MSGNLNHRYIARLIVKAETPLFVGSGDSSLMKDALVQKDHNGLPMIPGTALTGVLRHAFLDTLDKNKPSGEYFQLLELFGCQFETKDQKENFENWYKDYSKSKRKPDGLGSRLKISSANFLLGNNKVAEGIETSIDQKLKQKLDNLPSRQHVRITEMGVAKKNGLFDNEVVYQGARFVFEIELKGSKEDEMVWDNIINEFRNPLFRIGQGTRNGYGKLTIEKLFTRTYDLNNQSDFESYLNFDPSFNAEIQFKELNEESDNAGLSSYKLCLKPDDFFIFSKGFGDDEADNKPLTEEVMVYENEEIKFVEKTIIPATSIKGAIAHRVCYHYNKLKKHFAETTPGATAINNEAVFQLFGAEQGTKGRISGQRGKVVIDDLYYEDIDNSKILNHVAIDRFTGGAMDGALFSEKVSRKKDNKIELEVFLTKIEYSTIENNTGIYFSEIILALENALEDICKGLLPLGGLTTKGHGMFTGVLYRGQEKIFSYDEKSEPCKA